MGYFFKNRQISTFQIIILGFLLVIFIGTALLMLPISTKGSANASLLEALFTATSATCVTGLVVQDTATYWSGFGQLVILLLIQIGGMGVVTVAVAVSMISGKKIGLMQRSTMKEAISAPKVGGIVRMTHFILKTVFMIEVLGACFLSIVFCPEFGFFKGLWYAVFHSVSAFCNAGFDLMGTKEMFSSMVSYRTDALVNLVLMALIIIGGIGFFTWEDVKTNKWNLKRYRLQTKMILMTTSILLFVPFMYFYFCEFQEFAFRERIWLSLFQTVTPRTAGFNTADLTRISEVGIMVMIILMLIGGSPGSTAGGMKTTTVTVLLLSARAVFKRREEAYLFRRRIVDDTVKDAATIFLMYISLFLGSGMIISYLEKIPLMTALFETASAIGTVGLTLGVTTSLGTVSRLILIMLMYFGRVGGLTLIFAAVSGKNAKILKYPQEKITVG